MCNTGFVRPIGAVNLGLANKFELVVADAEEELETIVELFVLLFDRLMLGEIGKKVQFFRRCVVLGAGTIALRLIFLFCVARILFEVETEDVATE